MAVVIIVCIAPFLVNTNADEKARMTIKAVALAAAFGTVFLNQSRFIFRPSLAGSLIGVVIVLVGLGLTLHDARGAFREPGLGFILGPAGIMLAVCGLKWSALHWRCLGLFALAAVPAGAVEDVIENAINYSTIVAQVSAFSQHYVGFTVSTQGDTILFDGQAIRIVPDCSGLKLFFMLFVFFFIVLFSFPELKRIFWRMFFAATGTGFIVSILRIDFLVLIVNRQGLFDFFHHGLGSELISMGAILIFAFFIKEPLLDALEKQLPPKPLPTDNLPSAKAAQAALVFLLGVGLVSLAAAVYAYLLV
ncbi:MAG: archaeosortase/exosortase family protein [Verrucomicrobiota bacterium]